MPGLARQPCGGLPPDDGGGWRRGDVNGAVPAGGNGSRLPDPTSRWSGRVLGQQSKPRRCHPYRWPYSVWAMRAIVFVSLLLVTLAWDWRSERSLLGSGARGKAAQDKYSFVLVGIPLVEHVLPLRALAKELASRGHRVTVALPEGWDSIVADLAAKGGTGVQYLAAGPAVSALQYNSSTGGAGGRSSSRRMGGGWANKAELLAFMRWCLKLEASMFPRLRETLVAQRPDFLVVDRYAFAGMDAAHDLSLPYAVNNPTLLLDMDEPPAYMTPPYAGLGTAPDPSVWQRCMHLVYRAAFRMTLLQSFQDMNAFRASVGLSAVRGRRDLYGGHLVLSDTMFGIEAPRPLRPLHRMVGALSDGETGLRSSPPPPPSALQSIKPGGQEVTAWLDQLTSKAGRPAEEPVLLVHLPSEEKGMSEAELQAMLQTLSASGSPAILLVPPSLLKALPASFSRSLPATLLLLASSSLALLLALLRHPRVSTVLTSCGLSLAQEVLLYGKALICMPVSLDQREVAARLASLNLAASCPINQSLSQGLPCLGQAVGAVQNRTARQVWAQELLRSSGGPSRAADLLLHILEVGSQGLVPRADFGLPWYQYLQLDVLLVYSLILLALAALRMCWALILLLCTRPPTKRVSLASRNAAALSSAIDMGPADLRLGADPLQSHQHKLASAAEAVQAAHAGAVATTQGGPPPSTCSPPCAAGSCGAGATETPTVAGVAAEVVPSGGGSLKG